MINKPVCTLLSAFESTLNIGHVYGKASIKNAIMADIKDGASIVNVLYDGRWYCCWPHIFRGEIAGYNRDLIEDKSLINQLERILKENSK